MKTAILGLFAASALGCAAVADGRLETAVNAAEPITLVRGEEHSFVSGTIETPEGICNGEAKVVLTPEAYLVSCGDYNFIHEENETGGVEGWHEDGSRFWYSWERETWNWNPTCSGYLSHRMPVQNDPRGAIVEHNFHDYTCGGPLEGFDSSLLIPEENNPGWYGIDSRSPLTFTMVREIRERSMAINPVVVTEEVFEQKTQEYNSLREQMNVPEAERLWKEWTHAAFGRE